MDEDDGDGLSAPDLPVVTISPDDSYATVARRKAVDSLGEDGAWLAFSILHYGWRTQYDLARALATAPPPGWADDDPLEGRDEEYQIAVDLQIQGHMYAAAEQLATLVDASHAQVNGRDFFDTYVANVVLHQRIDRAANLDEAALRELLGVPFDPSSFRAAMRSRSELDEPDAGVVDLANLPTTEVGGLHIPQSAMDSAVIDHAWERVLELVGGLHTNLNELRQFVDRPSPTAPTDVRPQSLREVDNSFRHGLRVLFHRAVPSERTFRAVSLGTPGLTHLVEVYLPRPNEQVRFATVACSPQRTALHVEVVRVLCLRIGQVIRGLFGTAARSVDIPCVGRRPTEGCSPCRRSSRRSSSVTWPTWPAGAT